jgi:ATP-dependent DNA ligase
MASSIPAHSPRPQSAQGPAGDRRELLEKALEKVGYPVIFSRSFNAEPAELIHAARELQLEGIIAKRKDSCCVGSGLSSRA